MGSDPEPAKLLLPFLQRADELQKHEPLVAYYCRLYAMEKGLKIPQKERTKTTNALLVSLMNQLEKDKKSVKLGPEDNLYVEGFASNVFAKADKQDRAGRADLNTAKTFYAASIFFEILSQFGELQPDIEQKLKYAVWKAADIRKALKEGREPEPGPPGSDKDSPVPASSPTSSHDLERNESFSSGQPAGGMPSRPEEKDLGRSESFPANYSGRTESFSPSYPSADISPQPSDKFTAHTPSHTAPSPSSYPGADYPPTDFHQFPPPSGPEVSTYTQSYQHQPYSHDQPPMPQNYYPENQNPTYSHPNFQTYPSFHETSFPAVPAHQPSYHHGADASYSHQSSAPVSDYPSTVKYDSGNISANLVTTSAPPAANYTYDSNYQPSVEKISEAHKAARFAVGALAFDDVPVAVEFLRQSLELLTNPSAEPR